MGAIISRPEEAAKPFDAFAAEWIEREDEHLTGFSIAAIGSRSSVGRLRPLQLLPGRGTV